MIVSESVSVRRRRRVREGVEGVDVSGSVYMSVRVSVRWECRYIANSFVGPPSVPRILGRSSYSLLGPTFLVCLVPPWRSVGCALEVAVGHPCPLPTTYVHDRVDLAIFRKANSWKSLIFDVRVRQSYPV